MPQISVDEETYQQLHWAARVGDIPVSELVHRMVFGRQGSWPAAGDLPPEPSSNQEGWVEICKVYRGVRVEAKIELDSGRVQITSGRLAGQVFSTPSAAAIAVIRACNPERENPETNGWRFWKDARTGAPINKALKRPARVLQRGAPV